jgi:Peptidase family S41/N-terminal domain of Peptidase_S41 in eukaryotic IRBP
MARRLREAGVHQSEARHLEQLIEREARAGFGADAIAGVSLLRPGEDPAVGPDEVLVRVFVASGGDMAPGGDAAAGDRQQALDAWARAHEAGMRRMRRELSLRLPPARLLEFTIAGSGPSAGPPRITMPDDPAARDEPLSAADIVHTIARQLRSSYVFPDAGAQAAAAVEARLADGAYDGRDDAALAELLTSQLYELCGDRHLRVRTLAHPPGRHPGRPGPEGPAGAPAPGTPAPGTPAPGTPVPGNPAEGRPGGTGWPGPRERWRPGRDPHPEFRPLNFGISRVERLAGNIGYLDLRLVADPRRAGTAIAAVMELVSGTYALIIDLRKNGGGSLQGAVLWCSYLFEAGDTHLSDVYSADTGQTRQLWSLPHVPGARYLDRPVYVLTSARTFSGAEDIAYTLQAQGRAQVVGETTGGGAHPTRTTLISPTMALSVPYARSVNPVTGTNWEGTGVVPDVAVPAGQARDAAYRLALQHVLAQAAEPDDEDDDRPPAVPPPVAAEARGALAELSGSDGDDPGRTAAATPAGVRPPK